MRREGVESRRRAPTACMATVKACSRPRTRDARCAGAAKAEVARKSAALKSVSVRLRPRAPLIGLKRDLSQPVTASRVLSPRAMSTPDAAPGARIFYLQYKWPSDAIQELSALIRAPDSTCTMLLY